MLPRDQANDLASKVARQTPPLGEFGLKDVGLKDVERETILGTLRRLSGSRRGTAEALNMSERTLRHKLKQYREAGYLDGDDLL
jgi:DNA-binding NtrC family response regulator